jgi:hypothetical protein
LLTLLIAIILALVNPVPVKNHPTDTPVRDANSIVGVPIAPPLTHVVVPEAVSVEVNCSTIVVPAVTPVPTNPIPATTASVGATVIVSTVVVIDPVNVETPEDVIIPALPIFKYFSENSVPVEATFCVNNTSYCVIVFIRYNIS